MTETEYGICEPCANEEHDQCMGFEDPGDEVLFVCRCDCHGGLQCDDPTDEEETP
jgi:hypothetical protein